MTGDRKNKKDRRVGGGIKPEVMDSALLGLQSRVQFHQSELTEEKNPTLEVTAAKERVKEAHAAYKDHPCDAMHKALNDAHADLRRAITAEFNSMNPSKAFQKAKQKAMSLRAKADDVMKSIRATKLERNDAQMRADGMGVMRVDKKRAKLEAQFAMLVDEMRFYQSMMGGVYKNNDFSESEDFAQLCARPDGSVYGTSGQCRKGKPTQAAPKPKRVEGPTHRAKVGLGVRIRNAERKGDMSLAAKLREERMALSLKGKDVAQRGKIKLKRGDEVARDANANAKRVVKQEKDKKPNDIQEKIAAAKRAGQAKAQEDIVKRGLDKPIDRGTRAKAKGAGEVRVEELGSESRDARAARLAAAQPQVIKRAEGGIHDIEINGNRVGMMQKLPGDPRYQIQVGSKQERVAGLGAARARARAMAKEAEAAQAPKVGNSKAAKEELKGLLQERRGIEERIRKGDPAKAISLMERQVQLDKDIASLNARVDPKLKNAYAVKRAARADIVAAQARGDFAAVQKAIENQALADKQIRDFEKSILGEEKPKKVADFPKVSGIKGYDPVSDFDAPKNKMIGSGAMGQVKETKGPPPGIVKKGAIGENEALALEKLKDTGIAPVLHGQKITGESKETDFGLGAHVKEAEGYLAMSKAKGSPLESAVRRIGEFQPGARQDYDDMIDEYIKVRSTIHRSGVAHNDMHSGNFFYDSATRKGSLVDFGLSQVDSRAALAEALGTLSGKDYTGEGDWQSSRVLEQLKSNKSQSGRLNLLERNINTALNVMEMAHPEAYRELNQGAIRLNKDILDGLGLSDSDAKEYIDIIYDGI